ncbi:MAG: aminopeptidase P family protein [Actinobacteria bacterium]|nr:MAG: aminopeptidase P family protein [Actinomycetota bacterium]
MADAVLIYGDSFRSADMRHAVPLGVPDPFLYAERNGDRHVFSNSMEAARLQELGLFDVHVDEELGVDELVESGVEPRELTAQLALRAVASLGLERATVPENFPVWLADRLRAQGVELDVDQELFDDRRRAKTAAQLEGMKRAQRAAEAAMDACRELLRRAEIRGDELLLDGKQLTVERVKADMSMVFAAHDTTADEYIVAPGAQGAVGHDMGSGPIRPSTPLVVDIFPRDNASAVYTDMTRTFVVGDVPDDVREWHRLVKEALDRAVAEIRPGVEGRAVFEHTCDIFEAAGEPTQRTKKPGETLGDGFFHGLGHGVGLEVHEAPGMGRLSRKTLVAGDVVTVEPGLYRVGYGGVRLEDIVLVTENGAEVLTDYPYDLEP